MVLKKFIRIPGKIKGLFFVCRMDKLVPVKLFKFLAYLADLSKWISINKNYCKNDFYTRTFDYKKRETLYEQVITDFNLNTNIDYLEFGVSKGNSFKWWINRIKDVGARFYGFDTFGCRFIFSYSLCSNLDYSNP